MDISHCGKNRHPLVWALVLAWILSLYIGTVQAEQVPTQMLEEVRQSVVHIYAIGYDDDGKAKTRWTGSGFAVGTAGEDTDVFVTNWHVVTCSGKFDDAHVRFWILRDGARFLPNREPAEGFGIECRVLKTTDGYPDTAVIQALEPCTGFAALPLRSSRQVPNKTKVYALGFPGIQDTHNGTDSGPETVEITSGQISDHLIMTQAGNSRAIIHTARIEHGNSGGPLIDAEGAVVAQNTYGFEEKVTTKYFCAVYIDYAMKMLDELEIPYTALPGLSNIHVLIADILHMPQIGAPAAYIVFAVGMLFAAIFVLYFVRCFRESIKEIREKAASRRNRLAEKADEMPGESSNAS